VDSMEAKGCFFISIIAAATLLPLVCLAFSIHYYTHDEMLTAIFWLVAVAISGYVASRIWREMLA